MLCAQTQFIADLPDMIHIVHHISDFQKYSTLTSHIRFSGGQRKKWMSETLYLLPVTPVRHSTFLNIMLIYRNSASLSYMYRGARLTTCLRRYWGDRRPSRASQGRVCTRQLGNNCCLFCISLSEAPKYCTLKFSLRVFTKRVKGEWMNNCKQISLLYIYIYIYWKIWNACTWLWKCL